MGLGHLDGLVGRVLLLVEVVEEVFVKARVLDVVRGHFLLALDLHADLQADRAADGRLVRPLLQVVPHVHLARERAHLDDGLAEEIVRLAGQLLPQLGFQVVVLVPDAHLDAVGRVVALEVELFVPFRVEFLGNGFGPLLRLAHLDGNVGVRSAGLVLGDQPLRANHYTHKMELNRRSIFFPRRNKYHARTLCMHALYKYV